MPCVYLLYALLIDSPPCQHRCLIAFNFLNRLARTEFVNKPKIRSKTGNYATDGDELKLDCEVETQVGVAFTINWSLPNNNLAETEHRVIKSAVTKEPHPDNAGLQIGRSSMTVQKLNRNTDQGVYKCAVVDHSNNTADDKMLVTILGTFISLL